MTPEQQAAIAAVRDTLAEWPRYPRDELAASWWNHVRAVLQQVDAAFPGDTP